MGRYEARILVLAERMLGYHPLYIERLTSVCVARRTVSGGQFDWGGRLLKSNGGARRYPQVGWTPTVECKSIRVLNCETDGSSRLETRL